MGSNSFQAVTGNDEALSIEDETSDLSPFISPEDLNMWEAKGNLRNKIMTNSQLSSGEESRFN